MFPMPQGLTTDHLLVTPFDEVFTVEPNYPGWRLDRYLTQKLHRASRSQVLRMLQSGRVTVDGRPARPAHRVRPGQVVCMPRLERMDPDTPPLDAVAVLDVQHTLLALCKPPGMLVHRSAGEVSRTVERFLEARFPDPPAEPVHRLDRDTSGVLLCGRGADTIRALRLTMDRHDHAKWYLALVEDPGDRWAGVDLDALDTPLGPALDSALHGVRMGPGTLPCRTWVRGLGHRDGRALVACRLEQGRQHQIRVHLALAGTPVVGDKLYGMGEAFFAAWCDAAGHPALVAMLASRWHCLHAWRLRGRFAGRTGCWEAPPPPHMQALWPGLEAVLETWPWSRLEPG
jgi:23S rRNA pseudouridine1911/1915/1917 synthase